MIYFANSRETQIYEDGTTFVNYDDYVKLILLENVNNDNIISTSWKFKIEEIKINAIRFCVSYQVKKRDCNDYNTILEEKEATCEIYFCFGDFKWQVNDITQL